MCCIDIGGDGMECARKGITYRAFYFTGHRCVEKFMTVFRIDSCTIKRGNTCLHIGHLVSLERSFVAYVLGSSGIEE